MKNFIISNLHLTFETSWLTDWLIGAESFLKSYLRLIFHLSWLSNSFPHQNHVIPFLFQPLDLERKVNEIFWSFF
jgi:hypothetical protein